MTYDQIKGTVASLLFLFAEIEREARRILAKSDQRDRLAKLHGTGAILAIWKDLLVAQRITHPAEAELATCLWEMIQGPLAVRNGICHGLVGASSEQDDALATLSWRGKYGVESKTYDELHAMFAWLSKIPQVIAMISHAIDAKDVSTLRPLPERKVWERVFGMKFDEGSNSALQRAIRLGLRLTLGRRSWAPWYRSNAWRRNLRALIWFRW